MNSDETATMRKRNIMFLFGCIGTRALLVLLAMYLPTKFLPWMGVAALFPAVGFFLIFLTGMRKTGAEVFGNKIWWNALRPVHGSLYFLFAYLAITKNPNAWAALLADVVFGLSAFLIQRLA